MSQKVVTVGWYKNMCTDEVLNSEKAAWQFGPAMQILDRFYGQ